MSTAEAAALSVAVAALSALSTYAVTGYLQARKEANARALRREELTKERTDAKKKQEEKGTPIGTLIQDVRIDEIYLWEVEHLGKLFPSEGAGIENHMHGVGSSYLHPLADDSSGYFMKTLSSSVHSVVSGDATKKTQYNKLIGAHECILSDLVRKPGAPGVVQKTSAYVRAGVRITWSLLENELAYMYAPDHSD